jgi:NitT/TauT family transport system permease protein
MSIAKYISPDRQQYLQRIRAKKISIFTTQILILIIFFITWEVAADYKWIDPFITSQPSKMFQTIWRLHQDGSLYIHLGTTLWETFLGFTLGTLGGMLIAIFLWWSNFLAKVFDPYLVVLNSLPKVALGPILIVWLGNGEAAIIAMTLLISIIVSIISMLNGFLLVEEEQIKLMRSFGASKLQILIKVILPSSLPNIMSALKVNVGLSWVGVIMGEFLVSKAGLGYLIVYGSQVFQLDTVMASVLILAISAALMYIVVNYFEKIVLRWKN